MLRDIVGPAAADAADRRRHARRCSTRVDRGGRSGRDERALVRRRDRRAARAATASAPRSARLADAIRRGDADAAVAAAGGRRARSRGSLDRRPEPLERHSSRCASAAVAAYGAGDRGGACRRRRGGAARARRASGCCAPTATARYGVATWTRDGRALAGAKPCRRVRARAPGRYAGRPLLDRPATTTSCAATTATPASSSPAAQRRRGARGLRARRRRCVELAPSRLD